MSEANSSSDNRRGCALLNGGEIGGDRRLSFAPRMLEPRPSVHRRRRACARTVGSRSVREKYTALPCDQRVAYIYRRRRDLSVKVRATNPWRRDDCPRRGGESTTER